MTAKATTPKRGSCPGRTDHHDHPQQPMYRMSMEWTTTMKMTTQQGKRRRTQMGGQRISRQTNEREPKAAVGQR
jgi:hypothetical protein